MIAEEKKKQKRKLLNDQEEIIKIISAQVKNEKIKKVILLQNKRVFEDEGVDL
jgi:ribosome-binding factor A